MKVKELKEILNKYNDNVDVSIISGKEFRPGTYMKMDNKIVKVIGSEDISKYNCI